RESHVRLSRSNPDFPDEHILDDKLTRLKDMRATWCECVEFDAPLPYGVCGGRLRLVSDPHLDHFAGIRPAPDWNLTPGLKDHVLREDRGEPDGAEALRCPKE